MTRVRKTASEKYFTRVFNDKRRRCTGRISLFVALLASSSALAGWNAQPETIATHPTWVYTPEATLKGSDKRGLMIVLHGCIQTHHQIKNGANLEKSADQNGLIMAVPYVRPEDAWHPFPGSDVFCWGYDKQTADEQGHVNEIIELARELQSPQRGLGIDPRHVYVIGLSSGGALALKVGCAAPDVFAGNGAIAGPSVGSNQMIATTDRSGIPATNVDDAIKICKALAGDKGRFLQEQVTNIAHGDMDRNGPKQIVETPPCQQVHPGQNCVASIKWSEDNVAIIQRLYGAGGLEAETPIEGGKATERSSRVADKTVLSYLVFHNVGHAFPAGSQKPNDATNGQYVAQQGANYSEYVAQWLVQNNRRQDGAGPACITADNPSHVTQDRAVACGLLGLWACAKGSDDNLGFNFSFTSSSVQQKKAEYWVKVEKCP